MVNMFGFLQSLRAQIHKYINTSYCEVTIVSLLVIGFWLIYYFQSKQFGLYEDDLTIIPTVVSYSFPELLSHIWTAISQLYGHTRPFHVSFIYLFSWLGWRLGGVWGMYWIGYILGVLNLIFFYTLVRRASDRRVALLSALAYCLFSTDTTRIYLTHSLGLQPFILLLLLASHAYLSGKRWLAYILAFIILFGYETPFLVFLGIPLLSAKWDRKLLKEILIHTAIIGGMLLMVFCIRLLLGEGRVSELSTIDIIKLPIYQVTKGILANIKTLYYRPSQVITQMTPNVLISIIVSTFALLLLLFGFKTINHGPQFTKKIQGFRLLDSSVIKRFLAGMVMLGASYPITFILNATLLDGRDSRVHASAIVGASLIVGSLIEWMISVSQSKLIRFIIIPGIAIYLSLFVGFSFVVQNEYRLAWTYQKQFWTELLPLIQDARVNEIILIGATDLPETTQIGANTWNVPRLLDQIYKMPPNLEAPPRVYRLLPGWEQSILTPDGKVDLQITNVAAPPSLYGTKDPERIIFIEWDPASNHLIRRTDPLIIKGFTINILPVRAPWLTGLPKGILYQILFN